MANREESLDPIIFSIRDLEEEGSRRLPRTLREYYNGGAMDLITLQDNVDAYNRYKLRPRILKNVSKVDTSAELFGIKTTMPCGFSPTAMHCLAHPDGELATSRAAAKMGVAMALSSYSTTPLEDVKSVGGDNPYMVQMCIVQDRGITLQLLERAEKAGYKALFLSVDVPVLGRRLSEMRNQFSLPKGFSFPNILSDGVGSAGDGSFNPHAYDSTLEWDEIIPWLRKHTKMEIWLKGVISPEDVEMAIHANVDGVIISNHGGRQLDGVPATLDALRQCSPIAKNKIKIAVDGGIRRGSDIFKAIALGADFCFLGRIAIWGLAYNGQDGVELALKILMQELRATMALAGCKSIDEITSSHLSVLGCNGVLSKL